MTCHSGGTLEIFIEPQVPAPELWVVGVTPIARSLAELGAAAGWRVTAIDPAASADLFPDGVRLHAARDLAGIDAIGSPYVVVASQGQWDEEALVAAFGRDVAYVGLVASARRGRRGGRIPRAGRRAGRPPGGPPGSLRPRSRCRDRRRGGRLRARRAGPGPARPGSLRGDARPGDPRWARLRRRRCRRLHHDRRSAVARDIRRASTPSRRRRRGSSSSTRSAG